MLEQSSCINTYTLFCFPMINKTSGKDRENISKILLVEWKENGQIARIYLDGVKSISNVYILKIIIS